MMAKSACVPLAIASEVYMYKFTSGEPSVYLPVQGGACLQLFTILVNVWLILHFPSVKIFLEINKHLISALESCI